MSRNKPLNSELPRDPINYIATMQQVKLHYGRGFLRQLFEIAVLRYGPGRIHPAEYFRLRLYRPTLSLRDKLGFMGRNANYRFCARLAPPGLPNLDGVLRDKLLSGRMFAAIGLPCPTERAAFPGFEGLPGGQNLSSAEAIAGFVSDPTNLPVHGKPVDGSRGQGQITLSAAPDGSPGPCLPDGTPVDGADLARQITEDFAAGYVFQDVAEVHPALKTRLGVGATVRLVTLATSEGIAFLYALLTVRQVDARGRILPSMAKFALFDIDTGEILPGHANPPDLFEGITIPDAQQMGELAIAAHKALGAPGMIGWDAIPTLDGPKFLEANTRPHNEAVQSLLSLGLRSAAFREVFDAARAHVKVRRKAGRVRTFANPLRPFR